MRQKLMLGAFGMGLFGMASLMAQTPAPGAQGQNPSSQTPTQTERQQSTDQQRTLTGCLVQGSNPQTFILENVKASGAGAASSSASGASSAQNRYIVMAANNASSVDLKGELNHQVSVTGKMSTASGMSSSPSSSMGGSSSRPSSGAAGQSGESRTGQSGQSGQSGQYGAGQSSQSGAAGQYSAAERNLPHFEVTRISKLSDTCSTSPNS